MPGASFETHSAANRHNRPCRGRGARCGANLCIAEGALIVEVVETRLDTCAYPAPALVVRFVYRRGRPWDCDWARRAGSLRGLRVGFADVDPALEKRAVFNAD